MDALSEAHREAGEQAAYVAWRLNAEVAALRSGDAGPLVDAVTGFRQAPPGSLDHGLVLGARTWLAALGVDASTLDVPGQDLSTLAAWAAGGEKRNEAAWPLVVEHPLSGLVGALRRRDWALAFLLLRDTAEGVGRVVWAMLIYEVSVALRLGTLPHNAHAALEALAESVLAGFTFSAPLALLEGPACSVANSLRACGLELTAGLADERRWRSPLRELGRWRNADLGHGLVGSPERLADLLTPSPGVPSLLDQAVTLLEAVAPFLESVQNTRSWPVEGQLDIPDELVPLSEPVAWQGAGQALWLLEAAQPPRGRRGGADPDGRVRVWLRGVLDGRRIDIEGKVPLLQLAGAAIQAARPLGDPLQSGRGVVPQEVRAALAREEQRRRNLRTKVPELVGRVRALLPAEGVGPAAAVGPAGSGKSWLLEAIRSAPGNGAGGRAGRPLVLFVRTAPGFPLGAGNVVRQLCDGLDAAGRTIQLPGGRWPATTDTGAWWASFLELNEHLPVLVVLDGLDEARGSDGAEIVGVLPLDAAGHCLPGTSLLLGFRSLQDLPPELRAALAPLLSAERIVDVGGWYAGEEGRAVLARYVRERHAELDGRLVASSALDEALRLRLGDATHYPLADVVVERAQRRFLWVYHYARGLQRGFLAADAAGEWPTPASFYAEYLAHLERLAGGHPEYVRTLRRVLLVLAELSMPINERTLLWLLQEGPHATPCAESGCGERAFALGWVRPTLADLQDFLERRRLSPLDPNELSRAAWWVVADEVEGRRGEPAVGAEFGLTLAHSSLGEYLRSAELSTDWKTEREALRAHLDRRMADGFALWALEGEGVKGEPAHSSPVRLVQQRWANLVHVPADLFPEFFDKSPNGITELPAWRSVRHWCLAWDNACAALRAGLGQLPDQNADSEGRRAGIAEYSALTASLVAWGSALQSAGTPDAAAEIHLEALRLNRGLAGLPRDWTEEQLSESLDRDADVVWNLTTTLGMQGIALMSVGAPGAAVEAQRESLRLARSLAGLPEDWTEDQFRESLERDADRVGWLSDTLGHLGTALRSADAPDAAVKVHQEELRVARSLARLPEDWTVEQLRESMDRNANHVRGLCAALNNLGCALGSADAPGAAVKAHREGLGLLRSFAGLPEGWTEQQLRDSLSDDANRVRQLSIALRDFGAALQSDGTSGAAAKTYREALRLVRRLAGLPQGWTEEQLIESMGRNSDHVRGLALTVQGLGSALHAAGAPEIAMETHQEALRVMRHLAGMPEGWTEEQLSESLASNADLVRDLFVALVELGSPLVRGGAPVAAAAALREALRLVRRLAGMPRGWGEEQLRESVERRTALFQMWSVTINNLGVALLGAGDPRAAVEAHREHLRMLRSRTGLPKGWGENQLSVSLSRNSHLVRELSVALHNLASALDGAGAPNAAAKVCRENLQLARRLAGLPRGWRGEQLRQSLDRNADLVQELLTSLSSLAIALRNGGAEGAARKVAREYVRLRESIQQLP